MFVYAMSHPSASGRSPTWLWRILGERIYGNFICWNEKSLLLVKEGNLQKRLLFCMHYISNVVPFSSVQFSRSVVSNSLRSHESQHARPPCPSPTPRVHSNSHHWVGDAIQPSHPLLSPSPPPFNLSQQQGLRIRWLKNWSFSISHSNEYSGLISFRIDWFDLFVVQGTLKSRPAMT